MVPQMRTAANLSTPPSSLLSYDSTVATGGFNRYSLRAGFGVQPRHIHGHSSTVARLANHPTTHSAKAM